MPDMDASVLKLLNSRFTLSSLASSYIFPTMPSYMKYPVIPPARLDIIITHISIDSMCTNIWFLFVPRDIIIPAVFLPLDAMMTKKADSITTHTATETYISKLVLSLRESSIGDIIEYPWS